MLPNRVGVVFALAVVIAGGCSGTSRSHAQVETETLDVCQAVSRYARLDEPDPRDIKIMREYAEAFASILEHVDITIEYTDRRHNSVKPSAAVADDVATMRTALVAFRDGVRAPADADKVRHAQAALAADARFTDADRRLQQFAEKECEQ